jgi:hypothetical protein
MARDRFRAIDSHGNAFASGDRPITVGTHGYREFTQWMKKELAGLVALWAHTAAPIASHRKRRSLRKGRKQGK